MKPQIFLLLLLAGVFVPFAVPARAQTDSVHVALEQKANAGEWTPADKPAGKVEWSAEDPAAEAHPAEDAEEWLDGVEALQKVPEYTDREARRVRRDTLRAGKLNRRAARYAQREARAAEKPRRIKN